MKNIQKNLIEFENYLFEKILLESKTNLRFKS